MFAPTTPMRLTGCSGKTKKVGEDRKRVVLLTFQLQPFTSDMANDLNVKGRLFSLKDALPLPDLDFAGLRLAQPPQRLRIFEAPDLEKPSVEVSAVDIGPILKVRSDREGPVYSATFTTEFDYPTAKELLWLFHRVTEQVFVTLEAEQGELLAASV